MAFTPKSWANSPSTTTPISAAALQDLETRVTNYTGGNGAGSVSISASESTSSATYTTLTTPDQIVGVVLPTNGLIRVWYQATWQESVNGAARAAVFIGANQLQVPQRSAGATGTSVEEAMIGGTAVNARPLFTTPFGLASLDSGAAYSGDVTTGQAVGAVNSAGNITFACNGAQTLPSTSVGGGPCDIFAAAGTYTVSVQFKASSGSVTASGRKLWVQALSFS